MSLFYSYIEEEHKNMQLPPERANGGLYTGETAKGNWGAFYVQPEAHVYHTQNLLSAAPPPGAVQQPAAFIRPGNSATMYPYHVGVPNMQLKVIGAPAKSS